MAKKIYGSLETGNIRIGDKYALRYFNGVQADANTGNIDFKYYRKTEVNNILAMLPISRVGTLDYLPISVSGSFVGATSYSDVKRIQPCVLEDDGTMVLLRAGTDGSSSGFYYSYIRNIRNMAVLLNNDVVQSNNKFTPSFFTANDALGEFVGTNGNELLMYSYTNSGTARYAVSLTRGSFNTVLHSNVTFPATLFGSLIPKYAHIANDRVYFWCLPSTMTNNAWNFSLVSFAVSEIGKGNIQTVPTWSLHSGFSGTTILNRAYTNSPNIPVWDMWTSTGSTSLFKTEGVLTAIEYGKYIESNITAKVSPDGTKIRVALYPSYRGTSPNGVSSVQGLWISFTYDLNTRAVVIDNPERGQIVSTGTYNGTTFTYSEVNPYSLNTLYSSGFNPTLGIAGTICQSDDRFFVSTRSRWSSSPDFGIAKGTVGGSSVYDSLLRTNRTLSGAAQMSVQPVYGSAIGDNLIGPRFVSANKIIMACSGTYQNNFFNYSSIVSTSLGSSRNYVYNSMYGGTKTGYAPQSDRKLESNTGNMFTGLISLVDAAGVVSAYGTSFIENVKNTAGYKLDPVTMQFDATYSMSNAVLTSVKNAVLTDAGYDTTNQSHIGFYYVPDGTYSKSIAVVMVRIGTTSTGFMLISECDVTLSGTTITAAQVLNTKSTTYPLNVLGVVSDPVVMRMSGMCIAKYSGFNFMGADFLSAVQVPANNSLNGFVAKIKSGSISSYRTFTGSYLSLSGTEHANIPGVGFGFMDYDGTNNDQTTKLVVNIHGSTEAELDQMIAGTSTVKQSIVLASQEVPQNFNVYFTQSVPMFMAGRFFNVPPTSIDLSTVDASPANKTFYMYAQMNTSTGVGSYRFSTVALDEQLTLAYIGKVITGANGITTIDSEKVTRFLTYRPSTTKRGSAIPCSSGVPALGGTRWH